MPLIVLEGTDGAGKTTLAEAIARRAGESKLLFVSRRCVPDDPPLVHRAMERLSEILWGIGDGLELDAEFWLNVQAAWFVALSTHIRPMLVAGRSVVVDGWTYKFFAKLEIQGYSRAALDARFTSALVPDRVILISRPINVLDERTRRPTEQGLHAGYTSLGTESFRDYQTKIYERLKYYAAQSRWDNLEIGHSASVDDATTSLLQILKTEAGL